MALEGIVSFLLIRTETDDTCSSFKKRDETHAIDNEKVPLHAPNIVLFQDRANVLSACDIVSYVTFCEELLDTWVSLLMFEKHYMIKTKYSFECLTIHSFD